MEKINLIASTRELTLKWVSTHFESYLEGQNEHFFQQAEQAEQADNKVDQSRFMQTLDELNRHNDSLQQLYLQHIQRAFDQYHNHRATAIDYGNSAFKPENSGKENEDCTLSLLNKDELEEKLAIGAMSRKVSTDYAQILYTINQQLSILTDGKKITDTHNPVAPAVFGEALQFAITELTLDDSSRIMIYKLFESVFMDDIYALYELINTRLKKHGILPHLNDRTSKKPVEQQPETIPVEFEQQASQITIANQRQLIETIKRLLTSLQPHQLLPQEALQPIHNDQLFDSIQQLQLHAGSLLNNLESPQSVGNSNHQQLRQLAENEIKKTDKVDNQIIEIVGLLFEYVLNDAQLPDSVKALLSYLHTPILKIAISDKDFFDHPEHPARQLLNSLIAASELWVEPDGNQKNDIFQQIKHIVQRLLNEFDNNVRLFSELAFEFNNSVRQHTRRVQLTEKRAMQAAEGENKLKEIRLRVKVYIQQKINHIKLPSTIETLLFEPWSNFLAFNLLRFGSSSEQWREASQTVDDIIWFCQSHDAKNLAVHNRIQELRQLLPGALQAGFDTIGYDDAQGKLLLSALLQPSPPAQKSNNPYMLATDIDAVDISSEQEVLPQDAQIIDRLKRAELGTWFEFNANGDIPQRVKLTWADNNTLHFMFVNRMGQQIAMKSGADLAKEIGEGNCKILQPFGKKPFFEKAMERVLEQLRQREQNLND